MPPRCTAAKRCPPASGGTDVYGGASSLTGTFLLPRTHWPPARRCCFSCVEPVPQAGHGLSALRHPRRGAPGDCTDREDEVLPVSFRRQLLHRPLPAVAGLSPSPG